jgi:hypothetical protein
MSSGSRPRTRVNTRTQAEVLKTSRRRCCLCVGLTHDYDVKRLQIAHIDHNPANSRPENLVPLCLLHHDEYDSVSRHTKGITPAELRAYRDSWLFEAATRFAGPTSAPVIPSPNKALCAFVRRHPTFRAFRRRDGSDSGHQILHLQVHGEHLTVQCTEWISVGPLRGSQFVGRFKYFRGDSPKDLGTHELSWTGAEFVGSVRFDQPGWQSADIVWRPVADSE